MLALGHTPSPAGGGGSGWGLAGAAPALANDSTAELATGGLRFVHTVDIELRSQPLSVSPSEVPRRHHFVNKTNRPITSLIAFPRPDIGRADLRFP